MSCIVTFPFAGRASDNAESEPKTYSNTTSNTSMSLALMKAKRDESLSPESGAYMIPGETCSMESVVASRKSNAIPLTDSSAVTRSVIRSCPCPGDSGFS